MKSTRFTLAIGLLAVASAAGAQTDSRKTYIVQLADAPATTYAGTVSGLQATRPAAGAKLDAQSPGVRAYLRHLDVQRAASLASIGSPNVVHSYSYAFNGYTAQLTSEQVRRLKTSAAVLSVTESQVRKLDTTRTPSFLGLDAPGGIWSAVDANARSVKGENVIIGIVDSGVWPENASFGDKVDALGAPVAYDQPGTLVYGAPPAKWAGTCEAGGGFTAAMCNNKTIGARYYVSSLKSAGAVLSSFEYESPRDGGGHGTHTASTAGGNANVKADIRGASIGAISGVAPRARLAIYKVCWEATTEATTGCYTGDMLKAIDDAIKDGVDVINFSISGTQTSFLDPVQIAFLNASAAGVFVAASAGNSGPGNQVAHMSPWVTTVAASTHDRQALADLNLGNQVVFQGTSVFSGNLPSAPLVLSNTIPASGVPAANANLCFAGSLDAAAAVGKIVVCDRGVNDRVAKSAEVKRVGGVGMVLINPTNSNLVADFHSVPSIHLQSTVRTAVRDYAATSGSTASFGPPVNPPPMVAPIMASFSSRGPNKANGNILKPDITGPGVDVLAGYIDLSLTQAQHDAVVLGNFRPAAAADSQSGTSMSSPHVAGAAALLKQLHPSWSPAAIKSAMMTTTTGVKLASGSTDTDRWGYGAGHMNPNGSATPGLVYDTVTADYGRFLCGLSLAPPAGLGSCASLGAIQPWNLNLASLTASEVPGELTLTRRVTNVSGAAAVFNATATLPGWTVLVTPSQLSLAQGATGSFTVKLTKGSAAPGSWAFGSLAWSDGVRTVTSPLSARALGFSAPALVSDTRTAGRGSRVYSIVSGYTGQLTVVPTGLLGATRTAGNVATGVIQCFNIPVAAGTQIARFQLFDADTTSSGPRLTDLDLAVFNGPDGSGVQVGAAAGATSNELVSIAAPVAGTYSACVEGYATPAAGSAFTLSSWVMGASAGSSLRAAGPSAVYAGGTASIGISWNVPVGNRYLGVVKYLNGSEELGMTTVFVSNR